MGDTETAGATIRLTILGCGPSPGVPRINGDWGDCDPDEPKNRRLRCAALVERVTSEGVTRVVIDCGPDFRQQMLRARVDRLDAVALTHPHADHIHGIDDLRGYVFAQGGRVDIYADQATFDRVLEAFRYCFETPPGSEYPPIARHVPFEVGQIVKIEGPGGTLEMLPLKQHHGSITSIGWRIGPIAYCSDVSGFPQESAAEIRGVRHLVIGALQYRRHPSHLSVDQALDWIARLEVERATLTHMNIPLDYQCLARQLPRHVQPAYDGLVIEYVT